ncbi:MAG: HEAT repeat domain-containing protein [Gemmatimonadaceae bacterium]
MSQRQKVLSLPSTMPQPQPFVRSFAQLLWQLIHRAAAQDEQKAALRRALSQALTKPHEVALTELNISIAEAAHVRPMPEELPWISELSLRMAGHSVRAIAFQAGATANDVLGLARALAQPSVPGDEGEAFDAAVVQLGLKTINVYFGREGFVRRATPAPSHALRAAPARTPPLGVPAIGASSVHTATPNGLRLPTPSARLGLDSTLGMPPGFEPAPDQGAPGARAGSLRGVGDDTNRIYEAALANGNVSRELEQLLARIDAPVANQHAAKLMEEIARAAEERASEGLWVDVVEIARRLLTREENEKQADIKRAVTVALRRLMKPGILRGLAMLLPRRRELRDDVIAVLSRSGDTGSDVLIDLLVTTDSAPERRAFRVALTHCPSAVPALSHLLGDARWFVVRNAAELLGEMGVTESDGKLAQTARHADARVRRAAAGALSRLGTPRALHALQQLLLDKTPAVRLQAAIGLGAIRNPRAVPAVIDALEKEDDPDVQAALIGALGSMPTNESVERLRRAAEPGSLMSRKPTSVRLHALQALSDAGTHTAVSALRGFANDRDKEVRAKVDRLLVQRAYAS